MFRHSFKFARSLALGKSSSKPDLRWFIIGASGGVILASSLRTIHGDTQPPNRPPKDLHITKDSKPQRPSKNDPSAVFDGIRKNLDKLGNDISDLPDTYGGDNELATLEKISKDLELLGKGLKEFQKSIEALGKVSDAPQTDEQVVQQALTTHAASFIPDTQSGVARFDSVVVPRSAPFPTTNHIIQLISQPAIPPQKTT
jgi:pyruvate dehydrogenase phosphatase